MYTVFGHVCDDRLEIMWSNPCIILFFSSVFLFDSFLLLSLCSFRSPASVLYMSFGVFLSWLLWTLSPSLLSVFPSSFNEQRPLVLICLFILIYWDIYHWWSPIIPLLLPVSVYMHVDVCEHSFSVEDGNELWNWAKTFFCLVLLWTDSYYSCFLSSSLSLCLCRPSLYSPHIHICMHTHSYEQHAHTTLATYGFSKSLKPFVAASFQASWWASGLARLPCVSNIFNSSFSQADTSGNTPI